MEPDAAQRVISRSEEMGATVADAVARRACVFASGSEVIAGNIEDTNSPYLVKALTEAGFRAEFGGIIQDSTAAAVNRLEEALMKGFGLIVTTGGVGAENKDHSIEAVCGLTHAHTLRGFSSLLLTCEGTTKKACALRSDEWEYVEWLHCLGHMSKCGKGAGLSWRGLAVGWMMLPSLMPSPRLYVNVGLVAWERKNTTMDIRAVATDLYAAENNTAPVDPLTVTYPGISIEQAYEVQLKGVEMRCAQDARRIVGKKIGLTSVAMQKLLGVTEPDYGHLMDHMLVMEGVAIPRSELLLPKVEGEIAFVLKGALKGPGVTIADVLRATEGVMASIEIVDSRIRDWKIKLPDTIADNASSARFVLGSRLVPVKKLDLRLVGMVFEKNGEIINTGGGPQCGGTQRLLWPGWPTGSRSSAYPSKRVKSFFRESLPPRSTLRPATFFILRFRIWVPLERGSSDRADNDRSELTSWRLPRQKEVTENETRNSEAGSGSGKM